MALSEDELDQIIINQLSQDLSNIQVPNIEDQWTKIKQRIIEENEVPIRPQKGSTRKKLFIAVAGILLSIGFINFLYPTDANALGGKISEFFNHIVGKTTQDRTQTYRPPNEPAPPKVDNLGGNIQKEVTLGQAQDLIPFKLAIPSYLPSETNIKRVLLTSLGADVYQVSIEYDFKDQVIVFSQQNTANDTSSGLLYDTDDTIVKDLTVNGSPAMLFMSKNGLNTLNWQERGLVIEIRGIISKDEIIKIADSVK